MDKQAELNARELLVRKFNNSMIEEEVDLNNEDGHYVSSVKVDGKWYVVEYNHDDISEPINYLYAKEDKVIKLLGMSERKLMKQIKYNEVFRYDKPCIIDFERFEDKIINYTVKEFLIINGQFYELTIRYDKDFCKYCEVLQIKLL